MLQFNISYLLYTTVQGRREPREGPETTQILRISGFVQSKTGKKNGTFFSGFSSDQKKKEKVFTKNETFFCPNLGDLQKKKVFYGPPKIHEP